jgi:hypothetical protein
MGSVSSPKATNATTPYVSALEEGLNGTSVVADRSAMPAEPSSPQTHRTTSAGSLAAADQRPSGPSSSSYGSLGLAAGGTAGILASNASESSDLRRELAEAKADIERLKRLIREKDEGLRQRNTVASKGSPDGQPGPPLIQQQPVEGVPLQIVAAIAFGVFVFTWSVPPPPFPSFHVKKSA